MVGTTTDYDMFETDVQLFKTDSMGNMRWNATFDGSVEPSDKSLIKTMDGGYALVCKSSGGIWLVKLGSCPKFILTILVVTDLISAAIVGITLLVYFKKLN